MRICFVVHDTKPLTTKQNLAVSWNSMGALICRSRKKIFVNLQRFADRPRVLYASVVLYEVYENIIYILVNFRVRHPKQVFEIH